MKAFSKSIEEGGEEAKEVLGNGGNFDIYEIPIKVV